MSFAILCFIAAGCCAQSLDQKDWISIGGIRQRIWIKGNDSDKPLLLFLHGGPGNSVMGYANRFCDQLYDHFIVAHWDQRHSGETANTSDSSETLTFNIFKHDTEELADSLLTRFKRKKLFIAGHSWGTALGFSLVKSRPEAIEAFIAIGSMTNQLESERIALTLMIERAKKENDSPALKQLQRINIPFRNGEELFIHRKFLLGYIGAKMTLDKGFVERWSSRWLDVFNEASAVNLFTALPIAQCPVYFIAGKNDYQTNSTLAKKYYDVLRAPLKGFFWIENAGHNIPSTRGKEMQKIIIEKILKDLSQTQKSKD